MVGLSRCRSQIGFFVLRYLLLGLLWLAGPAFCASPLVDAQTLHALIADDAVRVIDIREGPAYDLQHVPTAVSAPYGLWHGVGENPGLVPPLSELTELVQSLGLAPDTRTVIVYAGVDATDFGGAARVYWTLTSLGMSELSVLNGGLKAWQEAGLPTTAQVATVAPSNWQPQFDDRWLATRSDVQGLLDNEQVLLVDARPEPFFAGRKAHPAAGSWGTLPGAVNLDNAKFFRPGSAALMSKPELADVAQVLQQKPGEETVSFCNTGHWAATEWFVLSEVLEEPGARLYPGSMVDWTQAQTPLPMANEPGRLKQLGYRISNWLGRS